MYGYTWDTTNGEIAFALSILPILLTGLVTTLKAAVLGFTVACVLGLVFAALRGVRSKMVSWPTALLVEFLRDTPLIVQLFFLYYVLPEYGIVLPAFLTGALALGLQYSAFASEIYRGGIQAVDNGQREAAKSLDLPPIRTFTHIILPQAIPRVIPALGNDLVGITKDVPILSVVAIVEMLTAARIIGDRTFNYLVPLTLVGAIYLILTIVASALVRLTDAKLPKRGFPLR